MTGKEMAKAIASHKGHVCVAAVMKNDCPYIRVVKSDIIDYFLRVGDQDADCEWRVSDEGVGYVDAH